MIEIAESLSVDFPEVGVDFYIVNNKPIIGEMTLFAGYQAYTPDFYDLLGKDIRLVVDPTKSPRWNGPSA